MRDVAGAQVLIRLILWNARRVEYLPAPTGHECRFSAFLDEAEAALSGDEGPFLYLAQHPLQEGETCEGGLQKLMK